MFKSVLSLFEAFDIPLFLADVRRGVRHEPSRRRRTTLHAQHGKREMSRRLRQIAAGQLRVENGLVA